MKLVEIYNVLDGQNGMKIHRFGHPTQFMAILSTLKNLAWFLLAFLGYRTGNRMETQLQIVDDVYQ